LSPSRCFDLLASAAYARAMQSKPRYHHGDLRAALVQSGLEILETEGLPALSLRGVAARAGVSHAAPAHHFKNLQSLLSALATVGFERFAAAMLAERSGAPASPAAQLRAASRGYIAFAKANPALFRLMFSGTALDWTSPGLIAAADAAFKHLAEISAPAAHMWGAKGAAGAAQFQTLIWSTIHGYAHLLLDCPDALPNHDGPGCGTPVSAGAPDIARFLFKDADPA
jgi:AcrR family transcriptional regulator